MNINGVGSNYFELCDEIIANAAALREGMTTILSDSIVGDPLSHVPRRRKALATANRIIKLRSRRNALLPKHLFGEPSWDMLLDLFVAHQTSRQISVSSLCIASMCAPTTALRHIALLVEERLVVRRDDPYDARRVYIELTDETAEWMEQLLSD